MTSAWGRLGTMERISVGLPQLDTSPSATSTASLNNMASTSSHFQGTGYGTSSSSVRILFILGLLFCESMFDGLCSSVVHSLPDSPFSLISPSFYHTWSYTPSLTVPSLWYHPHSIQPSYLRPSSLPYISIVILPTQCSSLPTICPYQLRILSWTSIAISPTFGISILYLSFRILSTFVTYHIHRSNFFYCAFCSVPVPILPLSCALDLQVHFLSPNTTQIPSNSSNRSAR